MDAVMSDDIDTLMFGSTFMIKNFSKESGTGTSAASHVTRYNMSNKFYASNVPFDRPGMILFAMLSGGDYLPSGVPKCGSKLAAEIAKAGFGEDLLDIIRSPSSDLNSKLNDWRERLQYELDENESGYFATKHKAVRIPSSFPDRAILEYYAEPSVSREHEMEVLRNRLRQAWDLDIDPLMIRSFAAEHLEWNYRSGARKIIKLLAEPLVSYRLRLKKPVSGLVNGTLAPNCDTPWLQKIHRSRANFGTDGMVELQTDMLPVDVVGIDLLAEPPNPQHLPEDSGLPQSVELAIEGEDDTEAAGQVALPQTPSKTRVTKRFDPLGIEKVWVFETVARLGIPRVVEKWDDEQAQKAASKAAPKKSTTRRTGPKKKGPIDPGMKRGSILKYGTLTKEKSELSPPFKTQLLKAATSASKDENPFSRNSASSSNQIDLEGYNISPSMYPDQNPKYQMSVFSQEVDDLVGRFSSLCAMSPAPTSKRYPSTPPLRMRSRASALSSGEVEHEELSMTTFDDVIVTPSRRCRTIEASALASQGGNSESTEVNEPNKPSLGQEKRTRSERVQEVIGLQKAISSLSLDVLPENLGHEPFRHSQQLPPPRKAETGCKQTFSVPQKNGDIKPPQKKHSSSKHESTRKCESAILAQLQCDAECPPLNHALKRSKEKSKSSKTAQDVDPRLPRLPQTVGHIENIVTSNGFWNVERSTGPEATAISPIASSCADHGQKDQAKKKRLPRVSILDMT